MLNLLRGSTSWIVKQCTHFPLSTHLYCWYHLLITNSILLVTIIPSSSRWYLITDNHEVHHPSRRSDASSPMMVEFITVEEERSRSLENKAVTRSWSVLHHVAMTVTESRHRHSVTVILTYHFNNVGVLTSPSSGWCLFADDICPRRKKKEEKLKDKRTTKCAGEQRKDNVYRTVFNEQQTISLNHQIALGNCSSLNICLICSTTSASFSLYHPHVVVSSLMISVPEGRKRRSSKYTNTTM